MIQRFLLTRLLAGLAALLPLTTLALANPSFTEKPISDVEWAVRFVSSTYDAENDTTTFLYEMTTASWSGAKDLSHWVLAVDSACHQVPVGYGTNTSFGLDPTTGVYGFKWDDGQLKGTTQSYALTFTGRVGTTTVAYAVKGGTYYAIGSTTGPSCDVVVDDDRFSIGGLVYLDANRNGSFDAGEPLLSDTSVQLLDASGAVIATMLTDAQGTYLFPNLLEGSYRVAIPANTVGDDLNELLAAYFSISDGTRSVTIDGANELDVDFGFTIQAAYILADFYPSDPDGFFYTIEGTGKTIGFWKHQLSVAMKGKGRAQIDAATMKSYLILVQALYLASPFSFPAGSEFGTAFDVLSSTSSSARDLLLKQLLASELNHVSGLGLTGSVARLQGVLIAWGEFLAANASSFTAQDLLQAKDVFDALNNTGE